MLGFAEQPDMTKKTARRLYHRNRHYNYERINGQFGFEIPDQGCFTTLTQSMLRVLSNLWLRPWQQ